MKTHLIFAIAMTSTFCFGTMNPENFRCYRTVSAPHSLSDNIAVFHLDTSLYRFTKDHFEDIRLFDDQENAIPFLVRNITTSDTIINHHTVHLTAEEVSTPRSSIAVIYQRKLDDPIPTQLSIQTPIVNFEKSVSVSGSNDKNQWSILTKDQPIFDYSQFIDIRNTVVSFKPGNYSYYKVVIDSIWSLKRSTFSEIVTKSNDKSVHTKYTEFIQLQEPFRLDDIHFSYFSEKIHYGKPLLQKSQYSIDSVTENTTTKTTQLYIHSNNEPIEKFELSTSNTNFTREVVVFGTDDTLGNDTWQRLGSQEVFCIEAGSYNRHHLQISLSRSQRYIRYRFTIFNNDNSPLTFTSVTGIGPRHEILFFHRGSKKVQLFYGANDAESPKYDIEKVLRNAPVIKAAVWKLGDQQIKSITHKQSSFLPPRYLFLGSMVLMVIILIAVLFIAVKKVDENTDNKYT